MKINNVRLKFFLLIIILVLSVVIYKTWEDKNSTNDTNNSTVKKSGKNSENLVANYDTEVIIDTDKNNTFESENDDIISTTTLKDRFGIEVNLEMFDSNNNGLLDFGEITPISLVLKNSSDSKYLIQDISIEGNSQIFDDDAFFGLTSNNAEGYDFSFSQLNLEYNPENVLVLAPGKQISFNFEIKWPIKDSGGNFVSNESYPYLETSFIVTPESGDAIYFSIYNQKINFNQA